MPKVLNTYTGPLAIAGVTVPPGGEAEVDQAKFAEWSKGAAASKWLEDGIVVKAKAKPARKPKATDDDKADEEPQADDKSED